MTQNEIIEMARQSGMAYEDKLEVYVANIDDLQDFAKLVAAKERADEREACCASEIVSSANIMANDMPHTVIEKYREAIRARAQADGGES